MKFSTVVENDSLDLDDLEDLAEEAGELAFDLDFFLRVFFGGFGMSGQGTGSEQVVSENKLYTDPSRDCSKSVIWQEKEIENTRSICAILNICSSFLLEQSDVIYLYLNDNWRQFSLQIKWYFF